MSASSHTDPFRDILQSLALTAEAQITVTHPACPTCDLFSDYELYAKHRREAGNLTLDQRLALEAMDAQFHLMPDEDFECWNHATLEHEGWHRIRDLARTALLAFGYPDGQPDSYNPAGSGVWKRASSTIITEGQRGAPEI